MLRRSSGVDVELGRERCALPKDAHVRLERRGTMLLMSGPAGNPCEIPIAANERVSLGIRGDPSSRGAFSMGIKNLTVTR